MRKVSTRRPVAWAVSMALAGWAQAQTAPAPAADERGMATLGGVVVTATGFEQQIEQAPASISVIQGEALRQRSFRDLTDALRDVEGVVVNGNSNETDISIRGMPADYTLILVDGKRQGLRDARVNGNRGYEQSFVPPAEAIERIEVVRGPMSSLYGSDAIGGVINIITRKVPPTWGGSVGLDYTAQQHGRYGNATQGQFYLAGPVKSEVLGLQLWGRQLNRQADDDVQTTEGFTRARHRDLTARLAITPSAQQDILLEGGVTRLDNGDGPSANWATREQENDRDHASVTHKGRWGWASSEVSLAWERGSRWGLSDGSSATQDAFAQRKPEVRNTVFDAKLVAPVGAAHIVTGGVQWNDSEIEDWNEGLGDRVRRTFGVVQKAVFVEDEWSLTDALRLTGGLRVDHHAQYGTHTSPRLYANWQATDQWTLKGGVSRGFKAPEIRAVVPGYAYLRRNRFVMLGNPDLQPETSTNYEFGALWSNRSDLSAGATVFYNDFKNKLSTVTTDQRWNGFIRMDRVNIDTARIAGLELHGTWQATRALALKANYTYLDSEQKSGANRGAPLSLTPEHTANLRADWKATPRLSFWGAANYYGKEYSATLGTGAVPAHTMVDLGASYQWSPAVTVNAALYNLGDKQLDAATYDKTSYGRRAWVGVRASF
ncbi:TonB-dependent receptor domain-containing protein [Paracidovorax wautersii]|uniref:Outer membrane receptor for ferrienterochelin and colicins n=1 Tax=Paracidovorax wautersii TaxID=1177982 RepID=A0ABU1IBE3_9BURK|nr:TonB-dependent receptor [Paracidovorax wautersii]MDR6213908.1 outer membrane receptor for ferrienterochelin and colicins [Paracidovorax wautersii]